MPKTAIRQRLIPFKLLTHLLYGKFPEIQPLPLEEALEIRTGPMCRRLRISASRFMGALKYLKEMSMIKDYEHTYGRVRIILNIPPNVLPTIDFRKYTKNENK
jgi:hypothetical protein